MKELLIKPSVLLASMISGLLVAGCPLAPADNNTYGQEPDNLEDQVRGRLRTAIIDTADGGCFTFETQDISCDERDITSEPHCTTLPAICANLLETEFTSLDDVTQPPAEGYSSDVLGYEDCPNVNLDKVIVFKLEDGTYAKAIITNDVYTEGPGGCDHKITLEYVYPMD